MFHRTNCDADPKEEPVACPVRPQLTDEQWLLICDLFPIPKPDPRGGRPRVDARQCSKACSGFCAAALAGKICLVRFRRTRLAGDASPSGRWMECGIEPGLDC